jgi:hypothetical protein
MARTLVRVHVRARACLCAFGGVSVGAVRYLLSCVYQLILLVRSNVFVTESSSQSLIQVCPMYPVVRAQ